MWIETMASKHICSMLLLVLLMAFTTVQAQLPSTTSKLPSLGKTATDLLKGMQDPLLGGPPSINVYNNGTFGQGWFDASRGCIKCDFTAEEPHGISNLTAAVHVAPWGEFALSTGGTPFTRNGVLDFWAKGSGLALVSIFFEDRTNRRWSNDVRLAHGANTTGLTLSDYDSDDWMRVQLDLDKLTDGSWLDSVTDPGWNSIVFRDISGMGFFMRLDKVQLVYAQSLLNFGASAWDPLLAPVSTLSPLYNQDFPGKLANPNRYIMRLRSTVTSPLSQMTDICNELKGAFNAAGVPQRFRGTCVSPAASWRFLTVDVDGDEDLRAMRSHLSDKVAYFEQDLTAFALPMRALRIHEVDTQDQGDQPIFNQDDSSQILGADQVTQEEQAAFPGTPDESPAPNSTVSTPPSNGTAAGDDAIKIVVQPAQLNNSTNGTSANVTDTSGDNGTVTAQGTQDEDKYTTQVEDPELDAAETATIQSSATSWGLDRIDQVNLPLNGDYEPGLDGRATHVYVLDTGVRTSHRDFQGRIGEGASLVSSSVWDDNGHGSHVAGIAAGAIHGVARSAIIHPVKVLKSDGSGSFSAIIEGMRWVREHKTKNRYASAVVVMSLGGPRSASLNDAVEDLARAGVSVVVAAGNNRGADSCTMSPASAASAIAVGSSTNQDKISSFSNIGRCLSLFAPGSQIVSASYKSDTGSATMSGTSMAAPHVAGAAALYMQLRPGAAPSEVKAALQKAAVSKFFESSSPQRLLNVMNSRLRSAAPGGTSGGSTPAPSTTQSRPAPAPAAPAKTTSSRPSYCVFCPWCMFCS